MKRLVLAVCLLLAATKAFAADNQAYLAIFAATKVSRMAGMPAMPALPPGMDMSKMPGMSMLSGAPERMLEVRLWSPSIAPPEALAYIAPPAGLKQGQRLDLGIYRPEPEKAAGPGEFNPDAMPDFTIKLYWGSSDTVKPGQPKIIRWQGLTAEQKGQLRKEAARSPKAGSYFYKPDWTTAYWPTEKQPGKISKDASLIGNYALTTNYTGNVALDAPPNVEFLAPIELSSPRLEAPVPLEPAIHFAWKPIPNALGLHAAIFGMEGKSTMVMWSSSEVYTPEAMSADWGYLEMAQVLEYVNSTVMMKGDRASVAVPAGIFANCDMAMFNMVGYGPGAALPEGQPLPRIQTKTTLNVMLGGKAMAGMGAMGGEGAPAE